MLAVVINPVQQLHRPAAMTLAQWAALSAAAGLLFFTIACRDPMFRETTRYSLQGLALMPLFYFAVRFSDNQLFRYLNSPLAITLGTYSYAIYLIHHVVIGFFVKTIPMIGAKPFLLLPAALLISIAYASAVDRFIDPYFRKLRRKCKPGLAKAAVA